MPRLEPFLERVPRSLWHVRKTDAYSSRCVLPRCLSRRPDVRSMTGNTKLKIDFRIEGNFDLGLKGNAFLPQIPWRRGRFFEGAVRQGNFGGKRYALVGPSFPPQQTFR